MGLDALKCGEKSNLNLDAIKFIAERIDQELFELGIPDKNADPLLNEASASLHKISRHYTDLDSARSSMVSVANKLIPLGKK